MASNWKEEAAKREAENPFANVVCKGIIYDFAELPDYAAVREIAVNEIRKQYADYQADELEEINDMIAAGDIQSADEYDRMYDQPFNEAEFGAQITETANKYMCNLLDLPKEAVVEISKEFMNDEHALRIALSEKYKTGVLSIEKHDKATFTEIAKQNTYDAIGKMYQSEDFHNYIALTDNLKNYSVRNIALVLGQKPDAIAVKGMKAWGEFDRNVKGASAIKIYAPAMRDLKNEKEVEKYLDGASYIYGNPDSVKYQNEKNKLLDEIEKNGKATVIVGFKSVNVFDITQTQPNDPAHDNIDELMSALTFNKPLSQGMENFDTVSKCLSQAMGGTPIARSQAVSEAEAVYSAAKEYAEKIFSTAPESIVGIKTREPNKGDVHKLEVEFAAALITQHLGISCDDKTNYAVAGIMSDRLSEQSLHIGRRAMFTEAYDRANKFAHQVNDAFDKSYEQSLSKDKSAVKVSVEITFSENTELSQKLGTYSFEEANALLGAMNEDHIAVQDEMMKKYGSWEKWYDSDENTQCLGYDKTDVSITVQKGDEEEKTWKARYDIGDENGDLYEHIKSEVEYHLSDEGRQFYAADGERGEIQLKEKQNFLALLDEYKEQLTAEQPVKKEKQQKVNAVARG